MHTASPSTAPATKRGIERTNARRKPREQWLAFIPGTHEGYVEWERFERIQRAVRGNLQVVSRCRTAALSTVRI